MYALLTRFSHPIGYILNIIYLHRLLLYAQKPYATLFCLLVTVHAHLSLRHQIPMHPMLQMYKMGLQHLCTYDNACTESRPSVNEADQGKQTAEYTLKLRCHFHRILS
jgi:hypothetical protein